MSPLLSALAVGLLLAGGCWLVVAGARRSHLRLADSLAVLDSAGQVLRADPDRSQAGGAVSRSDRLGSWAYRHSPLQPTAEQRRLLELKNVALSEFYADKVVMAGIGLVAPGVIAGCVSVLGGWGLPLPAAAALFGAVVGWFVPDLRLRRGGRRARLDTSEALFTYFDLVTLERLANRSATQSLAAAASLSTAPLFTLITAALERAQLEQRPPWTELHRLADQLELPELADLADVMRLDEAGAALADTLRARVRELRDAHLTRARIQANSVSEQMTIFMVIPAMVFGLIFLIPPVLRLLTT